MVHDQPEGRGDGWYQVFLPATYRLTHGRRNPIGVWLEGLGLWGKRSHEKFIPEEVFEATDDQIALFLRHLWATDGTFSVRASGNGAPTIMYSTTSRALATGVQRLLGRIDVRARVSSGTKTGHRPCYFVQIMAKAEQDRFLATVGAFGEKATAAERLREAISGTESRAGSDSIPPTAWEFVRKAMPEHGITPQALFEFFGRRVPLGRAGISRSRMADLAAVIPDRHLSDLAESDVLWDRVVAVDDLGEQPVFDATVASTHNFLANGIVVHNSIEQDSDVVMFIYRDALYDREKTDDGDTELIVAKHRNGPIGTVHLTFLPRFARFEDGARDL
jgi:replicative DNA helicase